MGFLSVNLKDVLHLEINFDILLYIFNAISIFDFLIILVYCYTAVQNINIIRI